MTPQELETAIQRLLDGTLPPEEFPELRAAMESDPGALDTYLDCVELHMMLTARADSQHEENPFPHLVETTIQLQRRKAVRVSLLAAVAVFVLLGIALRLTLVREKPPVLTFRTSPDTRLVVDHLSGGDDAPDPNALAVGSRLTVQQGFVEFTFASGVRSIVQGPADLTLHDDDRLYLASGQAWFHVPKPAVGFQVQTRELLVTDLGTEFAVVSTETAGDEVHVFDGRVQTLNLNGLKGQEVVAAGQARLAGPAGRLPKTPLRRADFLTALPTSLPHLHWSFDGEDPFQVGGTLPEAPSITTRPVQSDRRPENERLVAGKHGNALSFDGRGDQVQTDWQGFEGKTPRTLACWIKLHPADPNGWGSIAEWGMNPGGTNSFWRARVVAVGEKAAKRAVLRVGYGANWIDGETNVADGTWHHIAIVESEEIDSFGFNVIRFYVDGIEEDLTYLPNTKAAGPIETRSGQPLTMGQPFREGTRFHGSIDELFLFQGTLSPASIRRLMTSHQP